MHKTTRIALLSAAAFANAAAPAATPAAAKPAKAGAPKAEDRVAPLFTAPVKIDLPVAARTNGKRSAYAVAVEPLEVGFSIGIKNKTKKQISTQLSKINNAKDNFTQKIGEDGNPVIKLGEEIKDANGVVIGRKPGAPEMVQIKEYASVEVDPKTDPDGATVRIVRVK